MLVHESGLYVRYLCSRAHSAKRARDDRLSCIQESGHGLKSVITDRSFIDN